MHVKTETIVGLFIVTAVVAFYYMSSQLGSFRLDIARYAPYTLAFKDVSGLMPKADVKIAGVKVGWVESVDLMPQDAAVHVTIKVLRSCTLHDDSQALIRQEGLLGAKFLEIIPGGQGAVIKPGGSLSLQTRQSFSMDELFFAFQKIAQTVESVGTSSKEISQQAKELIDELKKSLAAANGLLAQFGQSTESCTESFTTTAQALKDAALTASQILTNAQGPVSQLGNLAHKIEQGSGSLGKLLTDTTVYDDVKYTSQFAKRCLQRLNQCSAGIDTHIEILPLHKRTNVKGYFDVWLHPQPNLFCIVGPVYSHLGFAKQTRELCERHCKSHKEQKRDNFRVNLQVGGVIPHGISVRAGLFQGTAGFGIDWILPFECLRWVSSFEAFDFGGHTRFDCDHRPYLKWINRLYFSHYGYLTFGANDFISKHFKSGFIGFGASFSTGDLWPSRC